MSYNHVSSDKYNYDAYIISMLNIDLYKSVNGKFSRNINKSIYVNRTIFD